MSALSADDFPAFFRAVHGVEPFPWQQRLVDTIVSTGQWPQTLALPTGSGKTATIDAAVFALAIDAGLGEKRRMPMRIAFVVDRRLIVDEAFDRAERIRDALSESTDPVLSRIRAALLQLSGGGEPLFVARLRGGAPREGDWTRSPAQPTVICSTVDQVGSRLLFRGYGVSPSMWPIHAGLFGDDALIVLDEVHLSEAFRQTLTRVAALRRAESGPWQVVNLSATPRTTGNLFLLDDQDRQNSLLAQRLAAAKPAALELLKGIEPGSVSHARAIAGCAIRRSALGDNSDGRTVAIVVNRVQLAARVEHELRIIVGDRARVLRVIGRAREIDKAIVRDELLARCSSRTAAAARTEGVAFIVATQAIEAGADLDVDSLVTQIAPFDALRQRFGRLNRMGRSIIASATVVATDAETGKSAKSDVVYGGATRRAWSWLLENSTATQRERTIDFGLDAMKALLDKTPVPSAALSPAPDAPILLDPHLDLLSRTRPPAARDANLAAFLHGVDAGLGEVQFVWRADLPVPTNPASPAAFAVSAQVDELLDLMPPRPTEMLALPIGTARRWFEGRGNIDPSDVESNNTEDDLERSTAIGRYGWRRRPSADLSTEFVNASADFAPGDIIVIPSSLGGSDTFGWNPVATLHSTPDVADIAAIPYDSRSAAFRVQRELLRMAILSDQKGAPLADASVDELWRRVSDHSDESGEESIQRLLQIRTLPLSWKQRLQRFTEVTGGGRALRIEHPYEDSEAFVIIAPRGLKGPQLNQVRNLTSATEGDEIGSFNSQPQTLTDHSGQVRRLSAEFARSAGLAPQLANDIALAGHLHDLGKADPRFQSYLRESPWRSGGEPIAKSGRTMDQVRERQARRAAHLPPRWRHEALSVRLARVHPSFAQANDPELVLWLIGTHHGWGRPAFPHADVLDERERTIAGVLGETLHLAAESGPQAIDFELTISEAGKPREIGWADLFARVQQRYGRWGLARLEAFVRLADHRASENPEHSSVTAEDVA